MLTGTIGSRAILIVDGAAPKTVAPGETYKGVKVITTLGDQALLEYGGARHTLRVGEAPASVGANASAVPSGGRIVLTAGSGGHFVTQGSINGQAVQFMVDTGATSVALGRADADRIGIDYRSAPQGRSSTANGSVTVWRVMLSSVRIGEVEIRNVEATILPAGMTYVLLGNSFLTRFQMKRENDVMTLERRF